MTPGDILKAFDAKAEMGAAWYRVMIPLVVSRLCEHDGSLRCASSHLPNCY